ncbi:MAG: cytochrome c3 family protein [Fidelibacterota bacterium]|nr:MAG: cytochrome c3 family protein [Candidatus Neomarinimicrobiota bacterium]
MSWRPVVFMQFAILAGLSPLRADEESSCVGCHLEQDPPYSTPAEHFSEDIHAGAGFGCNDCHGGDPEAWDYDEAKDPARGFIGIPADSKVVEVCSKCHSDPDLMRRYNPNLPTDQTAKFWTSGHGLSLKRGGKDAAQCASCHGTHGIKRSGDPGSPVYHTNVDATCGKCHSDPQLMEQYKWPARVVEQYRGSVHGVALLERGDRAAPTCNNCHGNHGAAPPEVGSIQEVCGVCHVNNQRLFSQTRMKAVFAKRDLHGCVVCHTAHDIQQLDDDLISSAPDGICSRCHQPGDVGALQADSIRAVLGNLTAIISEAQTALHDVENRGLEAEELLLDLQTAGTALVQSRTMVHTFDASLIDAEAEPGVELASRVIQESQRLLRDFRMRKIGLGIATIFISFLAVVLYLYIRTLD